MGLPLAAPNDTQPDGPLPNVTAPGISAHAVTEVDPPREAAPAAPAVPDAVLDGLEDAFDGRPRVRVVETPETHGQNGARYAGLGVAVARERVKTEPNAKIMVAPTTAPLEPHISGLELRRAARERLDAIVEDEAARDRRRAPTAVSTHEKKRRTLLVALGVLAGLVVLMLVVSGILIGRTHPVPPSPSAQPSAAASAPSVAPPVSLGVATVSAPAAPVSAAVPSSGLSAKKPHPAAPLPSPSVSTPAPVAPPSAPPTPVPTPSAPPTISPELKGTFQ